MNEENTTTTTEPASKPAKKAKQAKPAKSVTKAAPAPGNGGLRKPQVAVLKALKKAGRPITRAAMKEKSGGVDISGMVGCQDAKQRKENDKKLNVRSLLSLGYVRYTELDIDGSRETVYEITAAGKKALAKAE